MAVQSPEALTSYRTASGRVLQNAGPLRTLRPRELWAFLNFWVLVNILAPPELPAGEDWALVNSG